MRGRLVVLLGLLGVAAGCGSGGGTPAAPAGPFTLVSGPLVTLVCLRELPAAAPGASVERTALAPDGSMVAVGNDAGHVRVFDPVSGTQTSALTLPVPGTRWNGTPSGQFAVGYGLQLTGLAFLAGGAELLAVNGYGTLVRSAAADGTVLATTELPVAVACIAVNAAGTHLAVGTDRGAIEEFALPGLAPVRTYRAPDDAGLVRFLRYGPGDTTLLSALHHYNPEDDIVGGLTGTVLNGGLTRWDTATGALDLRFGGPFGTASAFQDPGTSEVLAGTEGRVGHVFHGTTGAALQDGFELHAGLGPIMVGGGVHAASCGFRSMVVVRAADRALIARADRGARLSRFTPRSFSSATATGRYAVGRQDGTAAVYEVTALAAPQLPQIVALDDLLGSAAGIALRVTGELVGHIDQVVEIAVSHDGRFVLTRDASGQVLVWEPPIAPVTLKPGETASTTVTALGTNLGICPKSPARITFGPSGDTALARTASGDLLRIALPAGTVTQTVQVMQGAAPVDVRAALDVDASRMLVASRQGGLFECNASGLVLQVLVADEPVGPDLPVPMPFSTLMHWPDGQILVAPRAFQPDLGGTQAPAFFDTVSLTAGSQLMEPYKDGRFAPLAGGSACVLGERFGRRGLLVYTAPTWLPQAGANRAAPGQGFSGIGGGSLLGAHGTHLQVLREQAGAIVSGALAHGFAARATAFGGSDVSGRGYVGLANGQVMEISAD